MYVNTLHCSRSNGAACKPRVAIVLTAATTQRSGSNGGKRRRALAFSLS